MDEHIDGHIMDEHTTRAEARIHWPGLRLPVTVLLDDPTPCRNPAWYEFPDQGHEAVVPNRFTEEFADLIDRTGAAGKFSVVPCPGAQGRIDEGMPGVSDEEMAGFLRLARERIAPRWDISPEMLTHNKALDLATMRPIEEREDVWAARQDERTLTPYIARGLEILRNVGLEPNGVTSPWAFGQEVEKDYARAIETALREVCGVRVGWYFLHIDSYSPLVPPRVARLDPAGADGGTALVSISTAARQSGAGHYDFAWRTQFGEPDDIDALLTADGTGGRLAELYANGSPLSFHTHWQSLFSNGSGTGLAAMGRLIERINGVWGERVRWTSNWPTTPRRAPPPTSPPTTRAGAWSWTRRSPAPSLPSPCQSHPARRRSRSTGRRWNMPLTTRPSCTRAVGAATQEEPRPYAFPYATAPSWCGDALK